MAGLCRRGHGCVYRCRGRGRSRGRARWRGRRRRRCGMQGTDCIHVSGRRVAQRRRAAGMSSIVPNEGGEERRRGRGVEEAERKLLRIAQLSTRQRQRTSRRPWDLSPSNMAVFLVFNLLRVLSHAAAAGVSCAARDNTVGNAEARDCLLHARAGMTRTVGCERGDTDSDRLLRMHTSVEAAVLEHEDRVGAAEVCVLHFVLQHDAGKR